MIVFFSVFVPLMVKIMHQVGLTVLVNLNPLILGMSLDIILALLDVINLEVKVNLSFGIDETFNVWPKINYLLLPKLKF